MTVELDRKPPGKEVAVARPTPRPVVQRWHASPKVSPVLKLTRLEPEAPLARRRAAAWTAWKVWGLAWYWLRGLGRAYQAWYRVVMCSKWEEESLKSEKYHDKAKDIHAEQYRRIKISAILLGAVLVLSLITFLAYLVIPARVLQFLTILAVLSYLVLTGLGWSRRKSKDPEKVRKTIGLGAITGAVLTERFRAAGLIGKDDEVLLAGPGSFIRDGFGYAGVLDLPFKLPAEKAMKEQDKIASILQTHRTWMVLKEVRSHAGQLEIWATREDPFAESAVRHPLLNAPRWNVWDPSPYALDARHRELRLGLTFSNYLGGGMPGVGKSAGGYNIASPFVLDASTRICVANGMSKRDWDSVERIADWYLTGPTDETALTLRDRLYDIVADIDVRSDRMRSLSDDLCPDNKLTEELARDPDLNMPRTLVVLDEFQIFTENGAPGEPIHGKSATIGDNIKWAMRAIVSRGRAPGYTLALLTQRPDHKVIDVGLRDLIGTRQGFAVRGERSGRMITGDDGPDCSQLSSAYPGMGYLIPDGEQARSIVTEFGDAPLVRLYYLNAADFRVLCERGYKLRAEAGTLPDAPSPERPRTAYAEQVRPDAPEPQVIDAEPISEALEAAPERRAIEMNPDHARMLEMLAKLPREMKVIQVTSLAASLGMNQDDLKAAALPVTPGRAWVDVPEGGRKQRICFRVRELITSINNRYREDGDAEIVDLRR